MTPQEKYKKITEYLDKEDCFGFDIEALIDMIYERLPEYYKYPIDYYNNKIKELESTIYILKKNIKVMEDNRSCHCSELHPY